MNGFLKSGWTHPACKRAILPSVFLPWQNHRRGFICLPYPCGDPWQFVFSKTDCKNIPGPTCSSRTLSLLQQEVESVSWPWTWAGLCECNSRGALWIPGLGHKRWYNFCLIPSLSQSQDIHPGYVAAILWGSPSCRERTCAGVLHLQLPPQLPPCHPSDLWARKPLRGLRPCHHLTTTAWETLSRNTWLS